MKKLMILLTIITVMAFCGVANAAVLFEEPIDTSSPQNKWGPQLWLWNYTPVIAGGHSFFPSGQIVENGDGTAYLLGYLSIDEGDMYDGPLANNFSLSEGSFVIPDSTIPITMDGMGGFLPPDKLGYSVTVTGVTGTYAGDYFTFNGGTIGVDYDTSPPPVPELPVGALIPLVLALGGGFMWLRKRK